MVVRDPHASGLLGGATVRANVHESIASQTGVDLRRLAAKAEEFGFLTDETGYSRAQASLRFVLSDPRVAAALPMLTNTEHLAAAVASSDMDELSRELIEAAEQIYEGASASDTEDSSGD